MEYLFIGGPADGRRISANTPTHVVPERVGPPTPQRLSSRVMEFFKEAPCFRDHRYTLESIGDADEVFYYYKSMDVTHTAVLNLLLKNYRTKRQGGLGR
jgi:hypothetical protein